MTEKQKEIVNCDKAHIIVKACPGSGKTYSVTARLAKLISKKKYHHQGIAVLSFTNNACIEIKDYLEKHCNISEIGYPHFIGTLDSFINKYIFFPFGHLVMECDKRPEIVGTEYNKWYEYDSSKRNYRTRKISDPDYYFDKVSINIIDHPFPIVPVQVFHFSWKRNKDGSFRQEIQDILKRKYYYFSQGKANQADANYLAYRLLVNYPQIAKNLAKRFPTIIIDEAQDTTELQMAILDILDASSLENLMLIGDPNQAIFEWNTADSSFFMKKYESEDWHKIDLEENRRSSQNICELLNKFYNYNMNSVAESEHCTLTPEILGHDETKKSITSIKEKFLKKCEDEEGMPAKQIAILYRGTRFGEKYFNLAIENINFDNLPWRNNNYHVRDIVHGKYLIDNGKLKDGLRLIEKGYLKLKFGIKYVSREYIQEQIDNNNFRQYRYELFNFIGKLPDTKGKMLSNWINEAEAVLDQKLDIKQGKGNVLINKLFLERDSDNDFDYYLNTIHSVKGSTYDAVLVFLKKSSSTKDYKTILSKTYNEADVDKKKRDDEEIRIVYVACSRPRKLLWIAVYEGEHKTVWEEMLLN
ncbi:MAG: ATP-dependent helicase [Candidatus Peribacteraceae bacterium]|nr:ATP-dependent helicase [Candidatus Peribacteraceae bacterium]